MSLTPYVHVDDALDAATVGDRVALAPAAHRHLTTVLRLTDGDVVEVADGAGVDAQAVLVADGLELTSAPRRHRPTTPRIVVAQAVPKGRRFDEVLRQVTELGVDRVVPLHTDRGVVRFDARRRERAAERWAAVIRAACEQARRPWRPSLAPVTPAVDFVTADHLVAHPGGDGLAAAVGDAPGVGELTAVIGPEGGFSDAEVSAFASAGARLVGLGPYVLRSEHAAAAAVTALSVLSGRWG